MEKRRKHKTDPDRYKEIHKEIKEKCKAAKNKWLEDKCQEIEQHKYNNTKRMFNIIREITRKGPMPASKCIRSEDGTILWEDVEMKLRWEEYINKLFNDDRKETEDETSICESGPSILKEEIAWVLRNSKTGKAAGSDEVYLEMILALGEEGVNLLWELFNNIYETGHLPDEMLKSIFIAIPKKPNTMDCENHRTISLMSHTLKLFLKTILQRVRRKLIPQISDYQYGFMPDRGTRNAIFTLRMLCERAIEHQQNVFLCFIDYQKAFDKVRHNLLLSMLKQIGIDDKDYRIIHNLYFQQKAAIKLTEDLSNWIDIKRGVRQGCVMSPDLFNLYSEFIFRELEEIEEGIQINGQRINNIRYADDTVLIASTEAGLQLLLNKVLTSSEKFGLILNAKKTKVLVVSKQSPEPTINIMASNAKIEQVQHFNYLGSWITSDARCEKEIKRRITLAKTSFSNMKNIFRDHKLTISLKTRLLKCFVWSVLLYGCETWTLTTKTKQRIEAVEMWFYRRILHIPWTAHQTNEKVLQKMNQKRNLLRCIEKRQLEFVGHVIRKEKIENLALSGRFPGKRARGSQRHTFTKNFNKIFKHRTELWETARNRTLWQSIVVHRGLKQP